MPIIRLPGAGGGGWEGAGKAAAAFDDRAEKGRRRRDRMAELEAARKEREFRELQRAQQQSVQDARAERDFAFKENQAKLQQEARARNYDLNKQQQDRLDAVAYSSADNGGRGLTPITTEGVMGLVGLMEDAAPGRGRAEFDAWAVKETGGRYDPRDPDTWGVIGDPSFIGHAYKYATSAGKRLRDAKVQASKDAQLGNLRTSLYGRDSLGSGTFFKEAPDGSPGIGVQALAWLEETIAGEDDPEKIKEAIETVYKAHELHEDRITARTSADKEIREYKEQVLGPASEDAVFQAVAALERQIETSDDPIAILEKIRNRIDPGRRAAALEARLEEQQRLAINGDVANARLGASPAPAVPKGTASTVEEKELVSPSPIRRAIAEAQAQGRVLDTDEQLMEFLKEKRAENPNWPDAPAADPLVPPPAGASDGPTGPPRGRKM